MKPAALPCVHIFDVDRTVIRRTSAEYFLRIALKEKYIRFSQVSGLLADLVKYKLSLLNTDFIENTVKKLSGLKEEDVNRISLSCFEKKIKPNIFSDAAALISGLINKGHEVIFATSSFDFIIKPLEDFFSVKGSLASRLEFKNGVTTGRLNGDSLFGQKKRQAAAEWINQRGIMARDVYFYSDSYTDLPLLEYCGHPAAVNPDRVLKRTALKNGWDIFQFKKTLG